MGSNLLTEGGGKGAGCVFILLIILEAALDKFTININKINYQHHRKHLQCSLPLTLSAPISIHIQIFQTDLHTFPL